MEIEFTSSNDGEENTTVSVNEITNRGNIQASLYSGGFGSLSVVAERAHNEINRAVIKEYCQ